MVNKKNIINTLLKEKSNECFINFFKNFELKSSLSVISDTSWSLDASTFNAFKDINRDMLSQIKIYVNQFILSYLANILLTTSDNRHKKLSLKNFNIRELMTICSCYINNLPEPIIEDKNIDEMLIRARYEQFKFNICEAYCIARPYLFYNKYDNELKLGLNKIFYEKTNLTIDRYFHIAYSIYLILCTHCINSTFYKRDLIEFCKNPEILIFEDEINNFLNTCSCSIDEFKSYDKDKNSDNIGSRYKFNVLNQFPIIKLSNNEYSIPNKTIYIRQICDLYWKFDNNFIEANKFRESYFDKIFDLYVGNLLKRIFGNNNVEKRTYKKGGSDAEFFDWVVKDTKNDAIYMFECKGYQLNIDNIKTGTLGSQYSTKFINKPIAQMYNRINDLADNSKYSELNDLRKFAKQIPFAIYYDIPYASGDIHKRNIKNIIESNNFSTKYVTKGNSNIKKIIENNQLSDFQQFKYYLLSIEDLEILEGVHSNNPDSIIKIFEQLDEEEKYLEKMEYILTKKINTDLIKVPILDEVFLEFSHLEEE